jgi:tRNA G18 (ribose-2'-O)-methylase SpoU
VSNDATPPKDTPPVGDIPPIQPEVGVGPHPEPWPNEPHLDLELLRDGDRRNVVDRYRYWSLDAIVADLDHRRHSFHVAIENWQHDMNIGTVVRTANAFLAAEIHIVGKKRWNRRGAMVTDRYQHVRHHPGVDEFAGWAAEAKLPLIGIDNLPGSTPLETEPLPERCVMVFGQEGPGLSDAMRPALAQCRSISQYGSTRSINAGVAAGVAMHRWITLWAEPPSEPNEPTRAT